MPIPPPKAAPPADAPTQATIPLPHGLQDEPAPDVVAVGLPSRPASAVAPAATPTSPAAVAPATTAPVAVVARATAAPVTVVAPASAAPVAVDMTLVDTITRIVTEMLGAHVRESVTAAVRALAPRLVVSLSPDGPGGD